jgi:hypothetical protein
MNKSVTAAVAGVLALASCADPTTLGDSEGIRVELSSSVLTIENASSSTIYHAAYDGAVVARIEWVGCGFIPVVDPEQECGPGVRPGERKEIQTRAIYGWGESPHIVVYWWHVVPAPEGGFQRDSIRAIRVKRPT